MAEALGYASVGRMLAEMTSAEVSEWRAYFVIKKDVAERAKYEAELKRKAREE
jgi:hypothetical protein